MHGTTVKKQSSITVCCLKRPDTPNKVALWINRTVDTKVSHKQHVLQLKPVYNTTAATEQ